MSFKKFQLYILMINQVINSVCRLGEFRNTQVGDINWLSAFSHYTMLWESPQKFSDLQLNGRASRQHPWKYKGNFRKYKENYSVRYFFIFLFKIEYLNNFRALGFILEVLTELLTPISIYFMYFLCHLSSVINDIYAIYDIL